MSTATINTGINYVARNDNGIPIATELTLDYLRPDYVDNGEPRAHLAW